MTVTAEAAGLRRSIRNAGWHSLPATERVVLRAERAPNGCLVYVGHKNNWGYGVIKDHGKNRGAHQVAWEAAHGPIPAGLWVLHHCDNPPCIETAPSVQYPDGHLFLGTHQDNVDDREAKGRNNMGPALAVTGDYNRSKTQCRNGHPYAGDNLFVTASGERTCRTCGRERAKRHYWKVRSQ